MFIAIFFLVGLGVGAALLYWYNRVQQKKRRILPKEWPLRMRSLVNSREKRVWVWLSKVMFDQHILVKLPVTRFTAPTPGTKVSHWYHLLNGVYCSFTVCNLEGQVIACIDVPGRRGLSMSNQILKQSLLAHCGVHYLVVDPDHLPHLIQIRTTFLGEQAARGTGHSELESLIRDVSENLHATVDRQRQGKSSSHAQLSASMPNTKDYSESQTTPGWDQNSFVTPLDSRSAALER